MDSFSIQSFKDLFKTPKAVIGMIHVNALPGTPNYKLSVNNIIEQALNEANIYKKAGLTAVMIENMHDVPYLNKEAGHEISTIMAIIGYEIKKQTGLICGIQILAGANKAALAAAKSAGMDFIRAEGFVFAHVADEGNFQSDAGDLLRYRKNIDATDIKIFTDIKKKHSSHAITTDVDIVETAHAASFFLSDGVILTGSATGKEADFNELQKVKQNIDIPVLVGSGINLKNVEKYLEYADGLIVGSYFKKENYWANSIDEVKLNIFATHLRKIIK